MDCSPPGSSVHGVSQARILEWVAISFSSESSQPRDQTYASLIGRQNLYHQASWGALYTFIIIQIKSESSIYLLLSYFSHVWLFATLWTVACQAPLSLGFSRQEYWSGLPCPPPGDLPEPGIEPTSLMSPELAGRFFTTSATWKVLIMLQIKSESSTCLKCFEVPSIAFQTVQILICKCLWSLISSLPNFHSLSVYTWPPSASPVCCILHCAWVFEYAGSSGWTLPCSSFHLLLHLQIFGSYNFLSETISGISHITVFNHRYYNCRLTPPEGSKLLKDKDRVVLFMAVAPLWISKCLPNEL